MTACCTLHEARYISVSNKYSQIFKRRIPNYSMYYCIFKSFMHQLQILFFLLLFFLNASANWKKEVALLQNRLRKHLSCWSHNHVLFRTSQPISYSVIQKTNSSAMIYCSIYVILYIFHVSLGENFTNVQRV